VYLSPRSDNRTHDINKTDEIIDIPIINRLVPEINPESSQLPLEQCQLLRGYSRSQGCSQKQRHVLSSICRSIIVSTINTIKMVLTFEDVSTVIDILEIEEVNSE
jgi:hypothetical protein